MSEVANPSMFHLSVVAINKTVPLLAASTEHLPPSRVVDDPPLRLETTESNRILAALSEVLVVIESHAKGGSMITVEEAQRRDITVMAVPGSPERCRRLARTCCYNKVAPQWLMQQM